MKLATDYTALFDGNEAAFEDAVDDVVKEAKHRARVVTGKFQRSIKSQRVSGRALEMNAIVGSDLVSARAHERGAYIRAKKHDTLFIPAGDGTVRRPKEVRIRATPAVEPAGEMFPTFMAKRLRERHAR